MFALHDSTAVRPKPSATASRSMLRAFISVWAFASWSITIWTCNVSNETGFAFRGALALVLTVVSFLVRAAAPDGAVFRPRGDAFLRRELPAALAGRLRALAVRVRFTLGAGRRIPVLRFTEFSSWW